MDARRDEGVGVREEAEREGRRESLACDVAPEMRA